VRWGLTGIGQPAHGAVSPIRVQMCDFYEEFENAAHFVDSRDGKLR
jgi:hypothetical protein